jgi:FkbM family methyltransferase
MSFAQTLSRNTPQALKDLVKSLSRSRRISRHLSSVLPATICVDVGASYYPHTRWHTFLSAPKVHWVAVEPNEANLAYLKNWSYPCRVTAFKTGLSRDGGPQTLHVTNVDSGSSLLPPVIAASMEHRFPNRDYFFPVKEKTIETTTLEQVVRDQPDGAPVFVKLDTQGTELSILQGAAALFRERRIVGIEMESTLLAEPIMEGAGKFWQACQYLESQSFELLHIKPIQGPSQVARSGRPIQTFPNECDAVFALRQDVARQLPVESRVALLAFYVTNDLLDEALAMLERDRETADFLRRHGCQVSKLEAALRA